MSRRALLFMSGLAVVILAVAGMLISVLAVRQPAPVLEVAVSDLPEVSFRPIPPGDRVGRKLPAIPTGVWLVRDGPSWRAYSNRSTHRGCKLEWRQEEQLFLDPCSGAVWTRAGRPVAGPAPRGLDWFPLRASQDGWVTVDLADPQLGTSRYSQEDTSRALRTELLPLAERWARRKYGTEARVSLRFIHLHPNQNVQVHLDIEVPGRSCIKSLFYQWVNGGWQLVQVDDHSGSSQEC